MAGGEGENVDFYAVLGLKKDCTASELKDAYKKLALVRFLHVGEKRWHPDRCSAPGNAKSVEESKKKFQAIQQAYSVLSDANKRFLYDIGAYEEDDDDDKSGMGDFLSEMAMMMSQTNLNGNGEETLEELQELFHELFQGDIMEGLSSTSRPAFHEEFTYSTTSCLSSYESCRAGSASTNKRSSMEMRTGKSESSSSGFHSHFQDFCIGTDGECGSRSKQAKGGNRGRSSRRCKGQAG